jgi:hypothetical protein
MAIPSSQESRRLSFGTLKRRRPTVGAFAQSHPHSNIQACTELTNTLRTSFGPNGRNKMVINHLDKVRSSPASNSDGFLNCLLPWKLFVTSDAATILRELEVVHPAAKVLVLASESMEAEVRRFSSPLVPHTNTMIQHTTRRYTDGRPDQPCPHICWRAAQKGRGPFDHGSASFRDHPRIRTRQRQARGGPAK